MFCKVSSWNVLYWVRLSKNYLNLSASFAFLQREASDIVNSGLDIQWFFDIRLTRAPIFPYLLTLLNNAMNDFSPERGPLSDWWGRCCPLPRAPPAFAFQLTAWALQKIHPIVKVSNWPGNTIQAGCFIGRVVAGRVWVSQVSLSCHCVCNRS